jgi:hypothetical protein
VFKRAGKECWKVRGVSETFVVLKADVGFKESLDEQQTQVVNEQASILLDF